MATLAGATAELVAVIAAVSGINHAPSEPTEQITTYPTAQTYTTGGSSINEPPDVEKSLHSINIAVLMPLNDIRQAIKVMLPLYEVIVAAIYTHRNGRTSSHYATFGALNYTLGPVDWPSGQIMYGYIFTLDGIKIQNNI